MLIVRILVAVIGALVIVIVLASAVRTVVLPRAYPARVARVAFLIVRSVLTGLGRGAARHGRKDTREELLSLQGPFALFAQIAAWSSSVAIGFAALMWAVDDLPSSYDGIRDALRASGSSLTTIGLFHPAHVAAEFVAYAEAGVGLVLLALFITYLPTIYGAFSRREALVTKLTVRTGAPPTPTALLLRSWELGRLERMEEVWNSWQDWFIDIAESHTSFPQLVFFRSPRLSTSWVTAAVTILDASAIARHALDIPVDSRAVLSSQAGVAAFDLIGEFLGAPVGKETRPRLPEQLFMTGLDELAAAGLPVRQDHNAAWKGFAAERVRYEPDALILAGLADAVATPWLPAELFLSHRPPVFRPDRRRPSLDGPTGV
jgi:hypothetical protein